MLWERPVVRVRVGGAALRRLLLGVDVGELLGRREQVSRRRHGSMPRVGLPWLSSASTATR